MELGISRYRSLSFSLALYRTNNRTLSLSLPLPCIVDRWLNVLLRVFHSWRVNVCVFWWSEINDWWGLNQWFESNTFFLSEINEILWRKVKRTVLEEWIALFFRVGGLNWGCVKWVIGSYEVGDWMPCLWRFVKGPAQCPSSLFKMCRVITHKGKRTQKEADEHQRNSVESNDGNGNGNGRVLPSQMHDRGERSTNMTIPQHIWRYAIGGII